MQRILMVMVSACLLCGCRDSAVTRSPSQGPATKGGQVQPDELIVHAPIHYANLTVFPVSSPRPLASDPYITLDEGLKAGTVEVHEVGSRELSAFGAADPSRAAARQSQRTAPGTRAAQSNEAPFGEAPAQHAAVQRPSDAVEPYGDADPFGLADRSGDADVNRLVVLNKSNKPLYLMPGEIIMGGEQDRAIAEEIVIAPSNKPHVIDVFCVEHGRWSNRDEQTALASLDAARSSPLLAESVSAAGGSTPRELAAQANRGKFIASVGSLNKASRLASQESKDQSEVWEKVASENDKGHVKPATGNFAANYTDQTATRRLQPYVETLLPPVARVERVVGVVVAVDGKVESLDVFNSTPLFKKLWPKLLKSYALDAANAQTKQPAPKLTVDDARKFLAKTMREGQQQSETKGDLAHSKRSGKDFVCFAVRPKEAQASASGALGGSFGGAIHASAFSK